MALIPMCRGSTFIAYDNETYEHLVCTGDPIGDYTVLGPLRAGASLSSRSGNCADVSADGALKCADYGGIPISGYDAAGADTYTTIVTAPRPCRYLHVYVATQAAIVSINGGDTAAFTIALGTSHLFSGLDIPTGAIVQAKNETAGQNYATLFISIW